jgi:hypothetical protein
MRVTSAELPSSPKKLLKQLWLDFCRGRPPDVKQVAQVLREEEVALRNRYSPAPQKATM